MSELTPAGTIRAAVAELLSRRPDLAKFDNTPADDARYAWAWVTTNEFSPGAPGYQNASFWLRNQPLWSIISTLSGVAAAIEEDLNLDVSDRVTNPIPAAAHALAERILHAAHN